MQRTQRIVALALLAIATFVAGWWSAGSVNRQEANDESDSIVITATARQGELGESYPIFLEVSWSDVLSYQYIGESAVVRAVVETDRALMLSTGSVLFEVDSLPVMVIEGEQPAYRDMRIGDVGQDVRQLQEYLNDNGYPSLDPDGQFGATTEAAVEAWMESIGIADVAFVRRGTIIFVPDLPRRVRVGDEIETGSLLQTGAVVMTVVASEPELSVSFTEIQEARFLASGADLIALIFDRSIPLEPVGLLDTQPNGGSRLRVQLASGNIDLLGLEIVADTRVPGEMIVISSVSGVIIPLAALGEPSDGELRSVLTSDSGTVEVQVLAIVGGEAVVRGIAPGVEVVVRQ